MDQILEILCPLDGEEKEYDVCIKRSKSARLRLKQGKPHPFPMCAKCKPTEQKPTTTIPEEQMKFTCPICGGYTYKRKLGELCRSCRLAGKSV